MNDNLERIKTGISGLDPLLSGGVIVGHSTLLCGTFGTGKTTFCLQFLNEGAKSGEPGIYITFEEEPDQLKEEAKNYGWDFEKYEKEKLLKIIKVPPIELINMVEVGYGQIDDLVKTMGVKRIVVDSIIAFDLLGKDEFESRKYVMDFVNWLKKRKCSSLLTMDIEPGADPNARFGIAESAADGIIVLYHPKEKDHRVRKLEVLKMRETKHTDKTVPFEITNRGIVIKVGK